LYIGDESFCVGMTLAYMRIVRALNDPASIISLWRDDGNKNTVLNEIFRTTIDGISASYCGIKFIDFERAIKPRVPHGIHNLCWMVHRASGGQKFAVKVREPLCYLECEGEAPSPAEPSEDRGAAARRKDPLPLQSLSVLAHIKNMKGGAGLEANYSAFLNTLTPGQREHPIWRTLSRTIRKQYAAQSVKEEGGTLVNCTEIIDALLLAAHHLYGEPPQQPSPELQGAGAVGVVATRAEVGA
jgi:hypothetical protein